MSGAGLVGGGGALGLGRGPVDLLVVAAMREEIEPLRAVLAGPSVALAVTGDGDGQARDGLRALLARTQARALLAVGVAGALTGGLGPGDLVVVQRVVRERGEPLDADPHRVAAAAHAAIARPAVAVTAARIADSVAEKRRLLAVAQAGAAVAVAAVVDMESAAFAEVAAAAGVPWVILRAVSDTADEALPSLLNRALDDGGSVRRGRVVAGLVSDPSALPRLMDLRRRVRACARTLAWGAAAIVGAGVMGDDAGAEISDARG